MGHEPENDCTVCVNALEVAFTYHVQCRLLGTGNKHSHDLAL